VNAFVSEPQVWALYVFAALGTSLWALGSPALRAMMPGLVREDQLAASQALQSIYFNAGAVAGSAVGGLLIAGVGLGTTYPSTRRRLRRRCSRSYSSRPRRRRVTLRARVSNRSSKGFASCAGSR
jgi:hypothetical protein